MSTNEAKRNTAIEATVDFPSPRIGRLCLTFANGKMLEIRTDQLGDEVVMMALVHGLKQKLVDAAAISRDPVTGATATIDTKYDAVREVYDRLLAGEWNKRRGDGESAGEGGLLYRALCKFYEGKKDPATVKAWLDGKTKAEQAALRANARIAEIIEEIRPKAKDADTKAASLLSELDNL